MTPHRDHMSPRRQHACQHALTFFTATLLVLIACVWDVRSVAWAEPRQPQVAGNFYPADPKELRAFITAVLERQPVPLAQVRKPRALILPHAGYSYSGIIAARGFREAQNRPYDAVIVVGFTHRQSFAGASVETRDSYATPLGALPVATNLTKWLLGQPGFHHFEEAHSSGEHSVEVMLPFVQVALGNVPIVPIMLGGNAMSEEAARVAHALAQLAARGDYLFIFSTDLSHYHPYDQARKLDEFTVSAMVEETSQAVDRLFRAGYMEACGRGPILTGLLLAQQLGLERRFLAYANSGDTTGQKSPGVVGYAAIGLYEPSETASHEGISQDAGMALVRAARQILTIHYQQPKAAPVSLQDVPELKRAHGMFVTLRRANGELRGCIGRIASDMPLATLLPTVTLEAALKDMRFSPVTAEELASLTIEVSVLTLPHAIRGPAEIVAGRDGVVLEKNGHSGVFLPQVWAETGWTRVEFLRELAHQKAGLDPDVWQHAHLSVFQVQAFEERSVSGNTIAH